jgi:DNA polymerase elongation subunit (family B)
MILVHPVLQQHTRMSQNTISKAWKDNIETPQDDIETLRDDIENLKKQVEVLTRDVKCLKANAASKEIFKGVWSSITNSAHFFAALKGSLLGIFGFFYVALLIKILS